MKGWTDVDQERWDRALEVEAEKSRDARAATVQRWGEDLCWLTVGLPIELAKRGALMRGFSCTSTSDGWLLVVKLTIDGIQQVVFAGARDPMGCMRVFRSRWSAGSVKFVEDKFARS